MSLPEIGNFWSPDEETAPRVVFAVLPFGDGWRLLFEDGGEPVDVAGDPVVGPTPERLLADAQALARAAVERISVAIMAAGAETPSGRVKTDVGSRELIMGAYALALGAIVAQLAFSQKFTFEDGSSATLDAAGAIGIGLAVAARVNVIRAHADTLIAEINAAADPAAVAAIEIESGWPA